MHLNKLTGQYESVWDNKTNEQRIREESRPKKYFKVLKHYRDALGFQQMKIGYPETQTKETFLIRRKTNEAYWLTNEGRLHIAPRGWQETDPKI